MGEADARTPAQDRRCRRQGQRMERDPNTLAMNDAGALAANGRTARTRRHTRGKRSLARTHRTSPDAFIRWRLTLSAWAPRSGVPAAVGCE